MHQYTAEILDAAGEGIYGLDLDGRVMFVNPAAARLTGHAVDELVGRSMHETRVWRSSWRSTFLDRACANA